MQLIKTKWVLLLVMLNFLLLTTPVYADSPKIRVGTLEYTTCNATNKPDWVITSVSNRYDIEMFTRDSLPQELSPSLPIEALKANAVLIRGVAHHYSNNPQTNWFCNNTGQAFNLNTFTIEGWEVGRSADEGNVANRTNDLVTETMSETLYKNGQSFNSRFNKCLQDKYIVDLANKGHNYNYILTDPSKGIYSQARCTLPQHSNLSLGSRYSFQASMTNGTSSKSLNGAVETDSVSNVNTARQAERYWGHNDIDATYVQPFGQPGTYMLGAHKGDMVEYLMKFGGVYENLHLIGISDIPGPVKLNIYFDGKYRGQMFWTEKDNRQHLRVDKFRNISYGTHAIAIQFAEDAYFHPYNSNSDRNFYIDVLGVNSGSINRARVRNMFLQKPVYLPLVYR